LNGYATKYLKARGQDCHILRPIVNVADGLSETYDPDYKYPTKISLRRATKAIRIYGAREAHWEGLILSDSNLVSGEIFEANNMTFLVQSVNNDPTTNELAWFAVTVNAILGHWRHEESYDENFNLVEEWVNKGEVYAYGEIITAELRQRDPGLLEGARYVFQCPKNADIHLLDRIVYEGESYMVEAADPIAMPGIVRVQAGIDTRPRVLAMGNDGNGDDEELED